MNSLHKLCMPRKSVFDPQKRDTVLDLTDLVDDRIDAEEFFTENFITEGKTRLKTASEFGRRMLSGEGFASSKVRQVLFATHQVTRTEETANGLNWLKTELPDYWAARESLIEMLDCLGRLDRIAGMDHWKKDSESARLLAGAVRNDHV